MALKLARREKYLISTAAALVSAFLLFQFLVFPFFEKREQFRKGIRAKEKELREMTVLSARYQDLKKNSSQMENILSRRNRSFTLFSFLEHAAGEAQVKDHIKYMKPSTSKGSGPYIESLVEMKLEGITLDQLVNYLYRIEKPEDLTVIRRVSISDNKKEEGYLDSILQVLTIQ